MVQACSSYSSPPSSEAAGPRWQRVPWFWLGQYKGCCPVRLHLIEWPCPHGFEAEAGRPIRRPLSGRYQLAACCARLRRFVVSCAIEGMRRFPGGVQNLINGGAFRGRRALGPDYLLFLQRYENVVNRSERNGRSPGQFDPFNLDAMFLVHPRTEGLQHRGLPFSNLGEGVFRLGFRCLFGRMRDRLFRPNPGSSFGLRRRRLFRSCLGGLLGFRR